MAKTDVAEVKSTQVSSYDWGDHSHAGFEDTTIQDLAIPFISVLQANSPEVEDQTIEGAKTGDLLNTVTREIIQQPLIVQPVFKEEAWVKWVPRNQGGGMRGRYSPDDEVVKALIEKNGGSRIPPKDSDKKTIPFRDSDGHDVIETHYVYCHILNEDGSIIESFCVLPFSSTKISVFKRWMTSLYMIKGAPPIYAHRCKVSTTRQKNESGSFFNFSINPLFNTYRESLINPATERDLLDEGRKFMEMIENGLARPDFENSKMSEDSPSAGSGAGGDEQTPF